MRSSIDRRRVQLELGLSIETKTGSDAGLEKMEDFISASFWCRWCASAGSVLASSHSASSSSASSGFWSP